MHHGIFDPIIGRLILSSWSQRVIQFQVLIRWKVENVKCTNNCEKLHVRKKSSSIHRELVGISRKLSTCQKHNFNPNEVGGEGESPRKAFTFFAKNSLCTVSEMSKSVTKLGSRASVLGWPDIQMALVIYFLFVDLGNHNVKRLVTLLEMNAPTNYAFSWNDSLTKIWCLPRNGEWAPHEVRHSSKLLNVKRHEAKLKDHIQSDVSFLSFPLSSNYIDFFALSLPNTHFHENWVVP